jgi:hypothetical protein
MTTGLSTDRRVPRPIPLRRKISFVATLLSLAVKAGLALCFIAAMSAAGIVNFMQGRIGVGLSFVAFSLFVLFLLFVWWVRLRYHVRRGVGHELRKRNCCTRCSYDLRASATRCPECGHPLATANIEI